MGKTITPHLSERSEWLPKPPAEVTADVADTPMAISNSNNVKPFRLRLRM